MSLSSLNASFKKLIERISGLTSMEGKEQPSGARGTRVFVSYKRGADPDESLAKQIVEQLSKTLSVFIDQLMPAGIDWGQRIEQELHACDFLIALLSAESIRSEMVQAEITTAHQLSKARSGHPVILPVRIAYPDPYPYPLSAYLNSINWTSWENSGDTSRVIQDLQHAIEEPPRGVVSEPQDASEIQDILDRSLKDSFDPLPSAGTYRSVPPETENVSFYIERDSDAAALRAIQKKGETIIIRAAVQMGKSHLLTRLSEAALQQGKRVVIIDLQLIDSEVLANPALFFKQLCARISEELDQEIRIDEFWNPVLGNVSSCTRYMEKYVLPKTAASIVLIVDELDNILRAEPGRDFVSMLRSWHNMRSFQPQWRQLDLVLAARTEPYMWLENSAQSPFNVGTKVELKDFSAEQVAELNRRYGSPLSPEQIAQLMNLVAGHPFLVRRSLYLLSSGVPQAELFRTAASDDGPFADHLQYHLFHLSKEPFLLAGLRSVLRQNCCEDVEVYFRLLAAGLVRRENEQILPRCGLYEAYFKTRIVEQD